MNIKERLRELRRTLAKGAPVRGQLRRPAAKPQQMEFSLPLIERSRALRLSPSGTR